MNLALNILLVFCVGVTYSSAGSTGPDVAHTEKSPEEGAQVALDHNKVQLPIKTNTSQPVISKTPTNASVKDEPVTEEIKTKTPLIENKNTYIATPADVIPKMQNITSANNTIPTSTKPTTTETTTATTAQKNITTTTAGTSTTTAAQKNTTTTTAGTSTTTATPVVFIADHAASTPTAQERQFDGPSFVGGIVLTVGLTVIGFIAFKFYKSGNVERSYRTL